MWLVNDIGGVRFLWRIMVGPRHHKLGVGTPPLELNL